MCNNANDKSNSSHSSNRAGTCKSCTRVSRLTKFHLQNIQKSHPYRCIYSWLPSSIQTRQWTIHTTIDVFPIKTSIYMVISTTLTSATNCQIWTFGNLQLPGLGPHPTQLLLAAIEPWSREIIQLFKLFQLRGVPPWSPKNIGWYKPLFITYQPDYF